MEDGHVRSSTTGQFQPLSHTTDIPSEPFSGGKGNGDLHSSSCVHTSRGPTFTRQSKTNHSWDVSRTVTRGHSERKRLGIQSLEPSSSLLSSTSRRTPEGPTHPSTAATKDPKGVSVSASSPQPRGASSRDVRARPQTKQVPDDYSDLDCLDSDLEQRVEGNAMEVESIVVQRRSSRISEMNSKKYNPSPPSSLAINPNPNPELQLPQTTAAAHPTTSHNTNSSSSSATTTSDPNRKRASTLSDGRPPKAGRKEATVVLKLSKPAKYDCMKVAAWEMVNHPDESRRALARRLSDVFEGRCESGWIAILQRHRKEVEKMVDVMMGGGAK